MTSRRRSRLGRNRVSADPPVPDSGAEGIAGVEPSVSRAEVGPTEVGEVDAAAGPPVPEDEQERAAHALALRQLTAQPRTRAELARAMRRRGIAAHVANRVLDRLAEVRLIDDASFAKAWVESRHAGRGLARRALAHELRHRGVADPEISAAVDQLDADTERATARRLAERKLRSTRGLPTATRIRRTAAQLARKGYPAALALRVVREALEAEAATDSGAEIDADSELAPEDVEAALTSELSADDPP